MTKAEKSNNQSIIKTKPTIFPLGFAITRVEKSCVIIEFIDRVNGKTTVIESIALPNERANELSQAIKESLEDVNTEE